MMSGHTWFMAAGRYGHGMQVSYYIPGLTRKMGTSVPGYWDYDPRKLGLRSPDIWDFDPRIPVGYFGFAMNKSDTVDSVAPWLAYQDNGLFFN